MSRTLSNKQENEKAKQDAIALYELEVKFKGIKEEYEKKKTALTTSLKNFMYCMGGYEHGFSFLAQSGNTFAGNNQRLAVKKITPCKIVWDADKLEKVLSPEQANKVISKQYTIDEQDFKELAKYLKSCGVSGKKFKSFLTVQKNVDGKALEQLEAVGEVQAEDLKDCYELEKRTSYLRINVLEDGD